VPKKATPEPQPPGMYRCEERVVQRERWNTAGKDAQKPMAGSSGWHDLAAARGEEPPGQRTHASHMLVREHGDESLSRHVEHTHPS